MITGRCLFHTPLYIAHLQTAPHRWVEALGMVNTYVFGQVLYVLFVYQPIILRLLLVLANLSQKHVFSRFRADHETADFAGISKSKQMGEKRHVSDTCLFQKISRTLIQLYNLQVASQLLCEDLELGKNCKKTIFEVVFMKKMPGLRTSASFCNPNFHPHAYRQTF